MMSRERVGAEGADLCLCRHLATLCQRRDDLNGAKEAIRRGLQAARARTNQEGYSVVLASLTQMMGGMLFKEG